MELKKHPTLNFKVSQCGIVTNLNGYAYKPYKASGYLAVKIKKDGKRLTRLVHRLVWETWMGEIPKGHWINHKDGVKENNNLENLECDTPSYNHCHARDTLKRKYARGQDTGMRKLTHDSITAIFALKEQGWSQQKIATAFEVSQSCISQIVNGETWASWSKKEEVSA